eukprot:TRINITY_DN13673_c0_g1_i1.p4 TRINITY_DN13673_c0_g1~~TRINITY_DN13673_c0_g1_i1.p4  ORF type:complete len:136 (-),score=15.80 TRINITY_DN13673_c0_g1_i1:61-447(-)
MIRSSLPDMIETELQQRNVDIQWLTLFVDGLQTLRPGHLVIEYGDEVLMKNLLNFHNPSDVGRLVHESATVLPTLIDLTNHSQPLAQVFAWYMITQIMLWGDETIKESIRSEVLLEMKVETLKRAVGK